MGPAGDRAGGPCSGAQCPGGAGGGSADHLRTAAGGRRLGQPRAKGADAAPVPAAGGGLCPAELRRPGASAAVGRCKILGRRRPHELPPAPRLSPDPHRGGPGGVPGLFCRRVEPGAGSDRRHGGGRDGPAAVSGFFRGVRGKLPRPPFRLQHLRRGLPLPPLLPPEKAVPQGL